MYILYIYIYVLKKKSMTPHLFALFAQAFRLNKPAFLFGLVFFFFFFLTLTGIRREGLSGTDRIKPFLISTDKR